MELESMLEKNRVLHQMMQRATVDALDIQSAADQLHGLLQCSVYIINQNGDLLGCSDTETMQLFSREELNTKHCNPENCEWLLKLKEPVYNQKYHENYVSFVPVNSASGQIGLFVCGKEDEMFSADMPLLAEYAATLTSVLFIRAANRKAETEARKKNVVQLALEVLSYSELEAVKYIFNEIDGNEGFLVASKLAEEYKLTRSVIVNALRKLESAGVIDARSLGMKGTYIKILNDYLYEELAVI